MGPNAFGPRLVLLTLSLLVTPLRSQVFVVGEKTATADAVTEFRSTHVELPEQPLAPRHPSSID